VPKPKPSTIKLQVFKGREAKLNKAIFTILAIKGPHAVYALLGEIKKQRGFTDTRYGVVRRRVEALEKQDFLMKVGTARTHVGSYAPVYQMTPRAELALALGKTNPDRLIKETDYARIIEMLEALSGFLKKILCMLY
jgi:hypothetical protein